MPGFVLSWLGHIYLARARRAELRAGRLLARAEKFFQRLRDAERRS